MLQPEITPFADAHIAALETALGKLNFIQTPDNATDVDEVKETIRNAQRALTRFKICAEDEWTQKERLRKIANNCRFNHK